MKHNARASAPFALLLFCALFVFLAGCAAGDPDRLITPASFVEEAVYPVRCETVKERLRQGFAKREGTAFFFFDEKFEEFPGAGGHECGRFVHNGGFMGGADVVVLLEEPAYGSTHLTVYQPYRSNATTDMARAIMEMAGREQ